MFVVALQLALGVGHGADDNPTMRTLRTGADRRFRNDARAAEVLGFGLAPLLFTERGGMTARDS